MTLRRIRITANGNRSCWVDDVLGLLDWSCGGGIMKQGPTWSQVLPWMLQALESNESSPELKKEIRDELRRMAKQADAYNAGGDS